MVIVPLHSCGAFQVYAPQSNLSSNFPIYSQIYLLYMSTSGFHIRCGGIRRSFTPEYSVVFHLKFMSFHSCKVMAREEIFVKNNYIDIYIEIYDSKQQYFILQETKFELCYNILRQSSKIQEMFRVLLCTY